MLKTQQLDSLRDLVGVSAPRQDLEPAVACRSPHDPQGTATDARNQGHQSLETAPHHVQAALEHLSRGMLAGSSRRGLGRKTIRNEVPFGIAQIARESHPQSVPAMRHTVLNLLRLSVSSYSMTSA